MVKQYIKSQYVMRLISGIVISIAITAVYPSNAFCSHYSNRVKSKFNRSVIDYCRYVHPKYKKKIRRQTKYIIVHTSEGGLKSTLNTVCKGKFIKNRRITYGGHANYVIARNGKTYRILDKKYMADHAGLSMWNGQTNLSKISIGIELVGFHYTNITDQQYRSVSILIDILEDVYHLNDKCVLTHSQISYGKPNLWFHRNHRGRKRCAKNFDRSKAGLDPTWDYDPDVKAHRLSPDIKLASIFYGKHKPQQVQTELESNVITKDNTAWSIAGEDYDSQTTLYKLPNGKTISGDKIASLIGWGSIPVNTVVLINQQDDETEQMESETIKTIGNGATAWSFTGQDYKKATTFYFFPNGKIKNGRQISDWDDLPEKTKLILGYQGPYRITPHRPPLKIAGMNYKHKKTLYYFPDNTLVSGESIKNFRKLPKGVKIFIPLSYN